MDLFIPKIRKWYTKNIRHQINCLQSLRKKYKSYPSASNLDCIKVAEEKLHISIQQA